MPAIDLDPIDFTPETSPAPAGPLMDADPPRSLGQVLELLRRLREHLVEGVGSTYAANLSAVRRDLRQLADRASEPELRDLYDSACTFIGSGGLGLLSEFRRIFTDEFNAAVASLTGQGQDAWQATGELSLVDAQDFERDLAVGKLAARATYACSQQLTALDRRVAALLGRKRLESDNNPLAPRRLFQAFLTAAGSSWAGEQLALVLLETFEHYTARALPGLYQELNQLLIDAGVLPRLPALAEDGTEIGDARDGSVGAAGGGSGISDVFVQMAGGLSQARYGSAAAALTSLAAVGSGESGAEATAQFAPLVLGQFLAGLTGLQRGAAAAAATLGLDTDNLDLTGQRLLHQLGQSPLLRWLNPNEAVTVDLTAMLFDCIFSDPEIPDSLREELGRLQVPVLKVALLNRAFFTDPRHPARRLLDLIAQSVRGWGPREYDALLKAIRSVVDNINAGFDRDTGVFATQVARLEEILQAADRRARERVSPLVRRLEQRDRKVVAEAAVADQIERALAGVDPPLLVRRFIQETWREVLRQAYIEGGEQGANWRAGLQAMSDLIWSVQPKRDAQERQRLMQLLPGLLEALPAGMARIGRAEAWDPFLARLMQLHMAAVRADAPPMDEEPAPNPPQPETAKAAPAAAPREPGVADTNDPGSLAAGRIAVGDWLAFRAPKAKEISLRCCWISRYGGLLLFADRPGEHARVLTRAQLAREINAGSVRVLSNAALTDRAVAALMVRAAPNGAPTRKAGGPAGPASAPAPAPGTASPGARGAAAKPDPRPQRAPAPEATSEELSALALLGLEPMPGEDPDRLPELPTLPELPEHTGDEAASWWPQLTDADPVAPWSEATEAGGASQA